MSPPFYIFKSRKSVQYQCIKKKSPNHVFIIKGYGNVTVTPTGLEPVSKV